MASDSRRNLSDCVQLQASCPRDFSGKNEQWRFLTKFFWAYSTHPNKKNSPHEIPQALGAFLRGQDGWDLRTICKEGRDTFPSALSPGRNFPFPDMPFPCLNIFALRLCARGFHHRLLYIRSRLCSVPLELQATSPPRFAAQKMNWSA